MKTPEKNPQLQTGAPPEDTARASLPEKKPEPDDFPMPDQPTIGENFFNKFTYAGIGYFANLGLSLVIWDFLMDGRGRPTLNAIAHGGASGLKALGMNARRAEKLAMTATEMGLSTTGGHLTMIPLKIAEDHARYFTHRSNVLLDKNYPYKNLKVTWNTPEDDLPPMVDEPTDQTWGQVAARRGLAMAAVTASGTMLDKVGWAKPLQDNTLNVFNRGVAASGSPALQRLAARPLMQRYTKLAALDSYFTVITSVVVAMTNHMFGHKKDGHEHRQEKSAPAHAQREDIISPALPDAAGAPSPLVRVQGDVGFDRPLDSHNDFRSRTRTDAEPQLQLGA